MRLQNFVAVGLFLFFGLGTGVHAESRIGEADQKVFFADVVRVLEREIYDHYSGGDEHFPIFNSNYDWHSSVHAHWAMFRLARTQPEYLPNVSRLKERFSAAKIAEEWAILKNSSSFELPYGRSWFMKFAIEWKLLHHEQGWADEDLLTDFADWIADSLLTYLRLVTPDRAFVREYGNPAWALAQLRDYFDFRGMRPQLEEVKGMVEKLYFLSAAPFPTFGLDLTRQDFFSVFGNTTYALTKDHDSAQMEQFLADRPVGDAELALHPSIGYRSLGQLWSRAWAFKAIARKLPPEKAQRYWDAFHKHVEYGIKLHETYKDNWIYTHWVTQFATYALTD